MITIKVTIESDESYWFYNYLKHQTWGGANYRIDDMEYEKKKALFEYLMDIEYEGTDEDLNNFIWFEWDDIYEEIKSARKIYEDLHNN